ncbi:MAG: hypothetical protein Q9217_003644 [Psora testacea]
MSVPKPSDSPPPSPTLSHDHDHFHELRPLIGQSMADQKDIDDVSIKADSSGDGASYRQAVLQDPALHGLTLYEKKALLVNQELDSHGMGKYQCRRYAFNLTVLIASVFGLCLAAPSNYDGILVLTAFVGFGIGGNIPIDTTICLEFLPQNRRFLLALLSVFQPIGVVVCSGVAYGLIPRYSCGDDANGDPLKGCSTVAPGSPCCTKSSNMGWRYTLIVLGAICLAVFFLRFVVFHFQESPKFLLFRGRDDMVVEVLHKIAKFNQRESSVSLEMFEALTLEETSIATEGTTPPISVAGKKRLQATWRETIKTESHRYKLLFSTFNMARLTLLVWTTYAFDYWGFSIAGSFLPKILLKKNSAIDVSVAETYRNFVLIYFPGIFGVLLGALMYAIPRIGRKWAMVGSSALMGISLFLFATVNTQASNIGLNAMEYFFQSMFNAVLYGWTPEAFPAPIRGTACGVASFWGRLFSIVAPLFAANLLTKSLDAPLYLAGAGVFVCTVAIMFMPAKSMGGQSY